MLMVVIMIVIMIVVVAFEVFIGHIIHTANGTYAGFVAAAAGAVHRTDVSGGVFRAGTVNGLLLFGVALIVAVALPASIHSECKNDEYSSGNKGMQFHWLAILMIKKEKPARWGRLLRGWLTGFEPATSGTTIQRSNQLSYNHQICAS